MHVFLIVPTSIFLKLQQCGAMRPDENEQWYGYTNVPSRLQAAALADFIEKDGTILSLDIPDDEVTTSELTEHEHAVFQNREEKQKICAVSFPELCLSFVKGQEMFLNTNHLPDEQKSVHDESVCSILADSIADSGNGDARYKALCILFAGDILKWKSEQEELNPSECSELCDMTERILSGDRSVAAELGIPPYGNFVMASDRICNRICRKYLSLQDLASEKTDAVAAGKILGIFERRLPFTVPITVYLRNSAAQTGRDCENSYRISVNARKNDRKFYRLLRSFCYVLRTREQELQEKDPAETPKMILTVEAGNQILATVTWEKKKFHVVNEIIRASIIRKS